MIFDVNYKSKKMSVVQVKRQTLIFQTNQELSAFALNFLRVVADGVG